MGKKIKPNDRLSAKQGRAFSDGGLWQLLQRVLGRPSSDAKADRSTSGGAMESFAHHVEAASPSPAVAPLSRIDVEVLWSASSSERHAQWVHHVLRVVRTAVSAAPSDRQSWTMRLRLREDVLAQCSLTIAASPDSLHLRFRSSDFQSLALLSTCNESLSSAMTTLVARATEVDVVDEYFGFA